VHTCKLLPFAGTDLEETLARLSSGPDTFRAHSSLQKWTEEGFGPDYFTFGEVKLDNGTLLYYNPNKTTELPAEIWLNLHESVITLPVRQIQVRKGRDEPSFRRMFRILAEY
jgi:hypothetical protein